MNILPQDYGVSKVLAARKQWVLWRLEARGNRKQAKIPYTVDGRKADVTNPDDWSSYEDVCASVRQFDGIGFVFSEADDLIGVDLDDCIENGVLAPWAREIINSLDSYTETSPSGKGKHIILRGKLPGIGRRKGQIEVYDRARYFTFTGNGEGEVEERSEVIRDFYRQTFDQAERTTTTTPPAPEHTQDSIDGGMDALRKGRNGGLFNNLWQGDWSSFSSQSDADLRLCGMLAWVTGGDEDEIDRLFRESGLYRDKWDERRGKQTYGEKTIGAALKGATDFYKPKNTKARRYADVAHMHPWQRSKETPEQRSQILQGKAIEIAVKVSNHDSGLAVIAAPPGVGKSHTVAAWGLDKNIAYIASRRDQIESTPALQQYHVLYPCTADNCDNWQMHNALANAGYNSAQAHAMHKTPCKYQRQFTEHAGESTVYQRPHATTTYVGRHSKIVIDEFPITDWYSVKKFEARGSIYQAKHRYQKGTPHYTFLEAWQGVLNQMEQREKGAWQGKEVFDMLNEKCGGKLAEVVRELANDPKVTNRHPHLPNDGEARLGGLPPIVLPHLWSVVASEMEKWESGQEWNSQIRVVYSDKDAEVKLTEPQRIPVREGEKLPPIVVLDATADEELFSMWAGQPVTLYRPEVAPPPNTKHIAFQDNRYGKTNLTKRTPRDRERLIGRIKFLMNKEGWIPEETGLVTFKELEEVMGEALGIPEQNRLHFFGARGSNALEGCKVLLVVGTPCLPPEEIHRLARSVYHADPIPLVEGANDTASTYEDPRVQRLADYITQAELTQVAHRNRALRHDGRMVVSFTNMPIDFLPVTLQVTNLPTVDKDGQEKTNDTDEKLSQAAKVIVGRGEKVTVRRLKEEAHVNTDVAAAWLQGYKAGR